MAKIEFELPEAGNCPLRELYVAGNGRCGHLVTKIPIAAFAEFEWILAVVNLDYMVPDHYERVVEFQEIHEVRFGNTCGQDLISELVRKILDQLDGSRCGRKV